MMFFSPTLALRIIGMGQQVHKKHIPAIATILMKQIVHGQALPITTKIILKVNQNILPTVEQLKHIVRYAIAIRKGKILNFGRAIGFQLPTQSKKHQQKKRLFHVQIVWIAKVQKPHNPKNKSFLFLHRETKAADFLTEAVILAVRIGQRLGVVELERARALVDEFFLRIDGHHLGNEHVMRA